MKRISKRLRGGWRGLEISSHNLPFRVSPHTALIPYWVPKVMRIGMCLVSHIGGQHRAYQYAAALESNTCK